MLIQILGSIFLVFALSRVYLRIRDRSLKISEMVMWVIIFGSILLFVVDPEITSTLADFVGLRRGTDLVVYASIALLFYLIFRISVLLENIKYSQVLIIRGIALMQHNDTAEDFQKLEQQIERSETKMV